MMPQSLKKEKKKQKRHGTKKFNEWKKKKEKKRTKKRCQITNRNLHIKNTREGGKKMKILVIGSINMDLVTYMPHLPKEGETLLGTSFMQNPVERVQIKLVQRVY